MQGAPPTREAVPQASASAFGQHPSPPAALPRTGQEVVQQIVQELLPLIPVPPALRPVVNNMIVGAVRAPWNYQQRVTAAHALRRIHEHLGQWLEQGGTP